MIFLCYFFIGKIYFMSMPSITNDLIDNDKIVMNEETIIFNDEVVLFDLIDSLNEEKTYENMHNKLTQLNILIKKNYEKFKIASNNLDTLNEEFNDNFEDLL